MLNYFNSFKKNAFRVEALQKYDVSEEQDAYNYFLGNGKLPEGFGEDWCDIIRQARKRGATMQRVHLIQFPISQYLSFELEEYKNNIKAGEEIFYIPFEDCSIKMESDFWIFDDMTVLKMNYDKYGTFLNFEEKKDISSCLEIKKYLLKNKKDIKDLF